jgi:eukaryotic-like serine/threonine-protein kinase
MFDSPRARCPDCGTPLSAEGWADGLCLTCLAGLAEQAALAPDVVLGERYRLHSRLGSGGMGEVWRAFDLKLGVDVALKLLRAGLGEDPEALESLCQEVRLAREVISPHVCRVFDLHEMDGRELTCMEHVDGMSLAEILAARGPLDLDEAGDLAAQLLAGLEAIHAAGLLHRDLKPENLMVTRTGRLLVMDLGLARSLEAGQSRRIAGTPAYMSPEQLRGEALDARADVFAAGVVLAEMVAPSGLGSAEDRQRVWQGIHAEEPVIADTPWAGVIAQAVAGDREKRLGSAAALARALEEVALRAAGSPEAGKRGLLRPGLRPLPRTRLPELPARGRRRLSDSASNILKWRRR